MKPDAYLNNGISFDKKTLAAGRKAVVRYAGLLRDSGASAVTMHVGYGDEWDGAAWLPMKPVAGGFEAEIEWMRDGVANMAFVDAVGNWDNFDGRNYGVRVAKARSAAKAAAGKPETTKAAGMSETVKSAGKPEATKAAGKLETIKAAGKLETAKAAGKQGAARTIAKSEGVAAAPKRSTGRRKDVLG